ncbi:MAG: ribulose-phosphate 3-epimerase [Candidatus Saccharimonadales bacterium]
MKVHVCPTITAYDTHQYRQQLEQVLPFAHRIHIDLMDGDFTPTASPSLDKIWLPHEALCDLHVMFRRPMDYVDQLIRIKPHMVIVQAEAEVHHMHFAALLHQHDIETGIAILQDTPVSNVEQIMHSFDQVLVFSGNLGYHGGHAELSLLEKVREIKLHHPDVEVAWDGGINADNASALASHGVSVLNVGGFIQNSENPQAAYATLEHILQ